MTSQYRHRRSSTSSAGFPTLEPGEISVNTANRQIAVGDAATGTVGQPKNLLALRYFDVTAQYVAGDYVLNNSVGLIYRANKPTGPGAFVSADWNMMLGQFDPQYVAKAGDVMTGMLTLPATVPTIGTHAANKTYVDTQDAALKTWVDSQDAALTGSKVDRAGDVMTGMLTLPATTPTAGQHATHKTYVDGMIAAKSSVLTSDTPPVGAPDNTLWVETDTGKMFVRINDGNSSQWVQVIAGSAQSQLKKNYIINGAMQVSQEFGNNVQGVPASGYLYAVDIFSITYVNTTASVVAAQTTPANQPVTPAGSPNRLQVALNTGASSIAAGDYCLVLCGIEGLRAADLRLGTAAAKTFTLQFGVKAPAGTYCVSFANFDGSRGYVAEYTIAAGEANADVVRTITVAGDTTGNWKTDNSLGLYVRWCLGVGSTFRGPAGVWGAGNFFGTTNQFNFISNAGSIFNLFDVSLTEGNVAPPFQVPDYASELALCKRYWQALGGNTAVSVIVQAHFSVGGQTMGATFPYSVPMRAVPTVTATGFTLSNCSAPVFYPDINNLGIQINSTAAGLFAWYNATAALRLILNSRI